MLFARSSYLYVGLLSFIASWAISTMTGCRFGNHVESSAPSDTISGYYDAQAQSLTFCASHGTTNCQAAATNLVPALIAEELTNPTVLIVTDKVSGSAYFTSNARTSLPVTVDIANKTLRFLGYTGAETLWLDDVCTSRTYLEESGSIQPAPANPVAGTGALTRGKIQLKVQVITTFDGTCGPSLQQMSDCYQDRTTCGGSNDGENRVLQSHVQNIFETYIQANVMSANDIPSMTSVAYEIQYD